MNKQFENKVVLVTGAASGIGRALCTELGQRRAVVVATDINVDGAKEVASSVEARGGRAYGTRLDVTRIHDIEAGIDKAVSQYGHLDFMFNNAGIAVTGEMRDVTLEHWRRVIDVNLFGVLYGTIAAYSVMVRQGFGHIVNIASFAGLMGFPINAPYAMTKHAIVGLSISLRTEAADLGVKVSVVCPGFISTNIWNTSTILRANRQAVLATIPFKMMEVRKAARAILRGVKRNKKIIIFPFHARLLWWINRIHPCLLSPLGRRTVRNFRATRCESEEEENSS